MKASDIKGKKVFFDRFRHGKLWYELNNVERSEKGFMFPVPVEDTGTAEFKREDDAMYFMRWIRTWKEFVDSEIPY